MAEENSQKIPEFEKCEKEREEYLNGWKRAKADLINYQKDEAKRFEALANFANAGLIEQLLTVFDSFDLAEKHDPETAKKFAMVRAQLWDVLKKQGLERIKTPIGQKPDPLLHESVGEVESDQPAGIIVEEAAAGYILNGRVIRPARVKLSKK